MKIETTHKTLAKFVWNLGGNSTSDYQRQERIEMSSKLFLSSCQDLIWIEHIVSKCNFCFYAKLKVIERTLCWIEFFGWW